MAVAKLPERSAFPPTSDSKSSKADKKVEKVISGSVRTREKSLGRKFSETFLAEDLNSVKGFIIFDVIVPAIKETVSNVVSNAVEMLLFGDVRSVGKKKNETYTSYSNYYKKDNRRDRGKSASVYNYREIIFDSRGEAEDVLGNLVDIAYEYGSASIADLYDLVGVTGSFTDNRKGWSNLASAKVCRARGGGYIIDLPRVEELD